MQPKPALNLIIGPAGEYYFFRPEIEKRVDAAGGFAHDFLYFLPVKRAVRHFKSQLIARAARGVLADPPIFTIYDFLVEFYKTLPNARKVISQAMRLFLVEESLKACLEDLQFFTEASARRRGLVSKVDALVSELREYGYNADLLQKAAESAEEKRRYHDFARLLEQFEAALGERLIDEAGAIQAVLAHFDEKGRFWRRHFPHIKTIYMSGYGLFSRPMLTFFERLRGVVEIKIKLDYLPENPGLFSHADAAFEALQALSPVVTQSHTPQPWETQLFQHKPPREKLALGKKVLIQPCATPQQEVAFIANYVKRLHLQEGIPLHRIGITFPSLEQYAPLIHEIFPRYGLPDTGLPYNLSTGFQLSQSPLIRSFMLVLEVPLLGYEVKKLLQLLASPFLKPRDGVAVPLSAAKQIAQELRLTHFYGPWAEELAERLTFLREQIARSREEDDFDLQRLQARAHVFEENLEPLQTLLERLETLEKRQPVSEFRKNFLALLDDLGFLGWYKKRNPHLKTTEQEKEFRAFNRFIKLLDQFSWIVTNLHGEKALSLKDFEYYLNLLVSQATYNLREWANFGLQIMPRLEILAVEPQVLIFGGMVESDFPRPYTRDVFFNDEERDAMGLAATEDLLAQDRYILYQVLSANVQRLVFTYPKFQKEAARVPSNFLTVLSDQSDAHWRRAVPSALFLQNQGELLEQVGRQLPRAVRPSDERKLRYWLQLHRHDEEKQQVAQLWLQRVEIEHRKRGREFGAYEGILSDFSDIVARLQQAFGDRPFSITRLETFAFCPIQFYLRYLLGLEEEREIETGITALERGEFVHQTLFRFYVALREQHRLHIPWLGLNLLRKIAEEEFARLPRLSGGLLLELEREKYFGSERHAGLWEIFLREEEKQITALKFFPRYFEVAFGRAGRKAEQDPLLPEMPAIELRRNGSSVKITGKVDRIDLNDRGQALLLDYKTGSAASKAGDVCRGTDLQLPVYALMLRELLRSTPDREAQAAMTAIYRVRDPENCQREPVIYDREAGLNLNHRGHAGLPNKSITDEGGNPLTFENMLQRTEAFLFDYVEKIRHGHFRHTRFPQEAPCQKYCEFRRMCRKDVRKLLENPGGGDFPSIS